MRTKREVLSLLSTMLFGGVIAAHGGALIAAPSYSFQVLATIGDPSPGGGVYMNDFEPGKLSNNGNMTFGTDVATGEQVLAQRHGKITVLGRSGDPAPGGGTYSTFFLGPVVLNEPSDAAYSFALEPLMLPIGVNAGLYRNSNPSGLTTAVVVPFVTPAPAGGAFQGTFFVPSINNRGDIAFAGIIATDQGIHVPSEPYIGLGMGVFRADARGHILSLVSPGDPAPGGGRFDFASTPASNDGGDVSFLGHLAGEPVDAPEGPQAVIINALTSLYLRQSNGAIISLAHAGDPAPGGGVFRTVLFEQINNRGDIVFTGDLTPAPSSLQRVGVFLYSGGQIIAVARPGDAMPGGGHMVTASVIDNNIDINNPGDIVFSATLDNDANGDGRLDSGLYRWSQGELSVIVRTGTVIAGIGTVLQLGTQTATAPPPTTSGAVSNERGQVIFEATLTDGRVVFLEATPTGKKL